MNPKSANRHPWSGPLTAYRSFQALEPGQIVEAVPIDSAISDIEAAFASALAGDYSFCRELLLGQALSLATIHTRLVEAAADAKEDWPKFAGLIDMALRAQEQSRKALELAMTQTGGTANGSR
jgi:hypothetical protein